MSLPNGPQTPSFLQLLRWIFQPLQWLDDCAQRYGDLFTVKLGERLGPVIFTSNPELIRKIFTADPGQFDAGKTSGILLPLLGDQSVILLDGDRHQQQRRLLMPPFHGERMRTYGHLITQIAQQVTEQWTVGEPFPVRPSMQAIALQVILKAVFGLSDGPRYRELKQRLSLLLDLTGSPIRASVLFYPILQQRWLPWSPWSMFLRQRQATDRLLYTEIQERREAGEQSRSDILSLLMAARDEAGQPMTDVELRDELMTLLVAGHETTASALAWALYWIHATPGVLDKLRQELDACDQISNPEAIARLPYLNAVCQETLRIYPIALITLVRVVNTPFSFGDYHFEAGTMLAPCIYLAHRRQDPYPEPERFRPERFLERQFSPYEFLPFGGGDRRCIGMAFALYEMKLALVTILSHVHLSLTDSHPAKPTRRGLTLAPPANLQLVVTQKQEPAKVPVTI